MAVTTTPLGFQKPDGNESIRNGDNVISANAQKAEELITYGQAATERLGGRVTSAEQAAADAEQAVAGMDSRVGTFEAQISGLSAQVAAVSTPFNIGMDLDGVPFFQDGATGLALEADTDGVPYFL